MLCSEWWAFEVIIMMAGILGIVPLASLTICLNIQALCGRMPLGITEASGSLMGNSVGANNTRLAKRFASLIFKVAFMCILMLGLMVVLGRA